MNAPDSNHVQSAVDSANDRRPERGERWPLLWVASTALAVLALATWQRRPGWLFLGIAVVGTAASAYWIRSTRAPRWWAMAATVLLAMTLTLAVMDTITLQTIASDWTHWAEHERESRATRVANDLTGISARLQQTANTVARDSALLDQLTASRTAGAMTLRAPLSDDVESALLVFDGVQLIGRAGQSRTNVTSRGEEGISLVDEPFYSSLIARARSADGRYTVATVALISAIPPADRFARAFTRESHTGTDAAHTTVESPDSSQVVPGTTVMVVSDGAKRLARVRALSFGEGEVELAALQRARARSAVPLVLAALMLLVAAWRRPARTVHRLAVTFALLFSVTVAPLSALSNVSPLFDASSYYVHMAGPLTANIAALLLTTSLGLAMLFLMLRSGRITRLTSSRALAVALVVVAATLGPIVLRDLSRGIALPPDGVRVELWIAWQLALALAGAAVLHAGAAVGRTVLGNRRGLPAITAPLIAISAAMLAPVLWSAPGGWPTWYPVLWALAIGALALTRRGVALVTSAAVIAGAGAVTLTWGATVRARMDLAQVDIARLSAIDENAYRLLERFATSMSTNVKGVANADGLLRSYAASELAQAGYPARLAHWDPTLPDRTIDLQLAFVADTIGAQAIMATMARASGQIEIRTVPDGPTTLLIAAVPAPDHSVTTVLVPPRTRLLPTDAFAALTGVAGLRENEPPYRLSLAPVSDGETVGRELQWRRRGDAMHGDAIASGSGDARHVHVEVDLRGLDVLVPRGALLVMLDVVAVLILWGASAMADGAFGRWFRVRRVRLGRSYRVRLSAALLGFFVLPATVFAGWSWYRLQDDDRATRELLVRDALRTAASLVNDALSLPSRELFTRQLSATSVNVGSPLFVYHSAQLDAASDTLLKALAPLGRLLPLSLDDADFGADDLFTTRRIPVGESQALVGFRRVSTGIEDLVVVTPARGDEFALDARREDLGVLLLFTAALGALAAIWLSGVAARSLARPVGALREAALSIAAGRDTRMLDRVPASEFAPVYRAFGRMAEDLSSSRAALEAAQRRTAAVLQHVASGVVALREDGEIVIANPRAEQLMRVSLRQSGSSLSALPSSLDPVVDRCVAFLHSVDDEDAFEHVMGDRQLSGRLTRFAGGAVLTLDDVTELATAQRVLAWGEMARQVAHEIKNPLTPIRLGVQHLRRAYRDGRSEFGAVLETNVTRILSEIDHLDEIARAFSRYGMAPDQRAPASAVDVASISRDVLALEQLGEGAVTWSLEMPTSEPLPPALAQREELKEVLLNILENARLAEASHVVVRLGHRDDVVTIDVRDDGHGIASSVLAQVFEPHFSTRTSGSGLGLAISRRLIEGWGGRIAIESTEGVGTVVHLALRIG